MTIATSNPQAYGTSQQRNKSRWEICLEEEKAAIRNAFLNGLHQYSPPNRQTIGEYVGLCILIDFPDEPGQILPEEVERFCNQRGYQGYGNNGSVYDYFYDISGGKVEYINIVIPYYYTAKNNKSYYTEAHLPKEYRQPGDVRASELVTEALVDLKNRGFDFSSLSRDWDGYIYAINIFYAGFPNGDNTTGLWPHQGSIQVPLELGSGLCCSIKAKDYQISNMGDQLTLGTFCHENGHMLCRFPDLYDNGNESAGVGSYCLMGWGGYGGNAKNPVQPCAYLKYKAGWVDAVPITDELEATLVAGENKVYIYYRNPVEYFIIENRFRLGRDWDLPDSGLAIWHVDELMNGNENEYMLKDWHYECSLVQADNQADLEKGLNLGDTTDLFADVLNQFSDWTQLSRRWWDGTQSGLEIFDISSAGKVMTFRARVRESSPQAVEWQDIRYLGDEFCAVGFLLPDQGWYVCLTNIASAYGIRVSLIDLPQSVELYSSSIEPMFTINHALVLGHPIVDVNWRRSNDTSCFLMQGFLIDELVYVRLDDFCQQFGISYRKNEEKGCIELN